jgi:hypothetical protein
VEFSFSPEQCTAKNPDVIKHPLANLNAKIVIILDTSLHTLQIKNIQVFIIYDSSYSQCEYVKPNRDWQLGCAVLGPALCSLRQEQAVLLLVLGLRRKLLLFPVFYSITEHWPRWDSKV